MRHGTWTSSYSSRLNSRTRSNSAHRKQLSPADGPGLVQYLTVCAYIFCVLLPAVVLAIYYTSIWDPHYVNTGGRLAAMANRTRNTAFPMDSAGKCDCTKCPPGRAKVDLSNLLMSARIPGPRTTKPVPIH